MEEVSAVGDGRGGSGGAGAVLFPPPAQASTVPDESFFWGS